MSYIHNENYFSHSPRGVNPDKFIGMVHVPKDKPQMKYELDTLFDISSQPYSIEIAKQTQQEITRLKQTFRRVIPGREITILQPYFQQIFRDLRDRMQDLYEEATDHWALVFLNELMVELEMRYYRYLDLMEYIPVFQALLFIHENALFLQQWSTMLPDAGIDKDLFQVISQVFQCSGLPIERISLGKCRFLNELAKELMAWNERQLTEANNEDLTESLIKELFLQNLNPAEFYLYCMNRLDQQVEKNTYAHEQLAQYAAQLNNLLRMPVMEQQAYEPRLPPIQELLARGVQSAMGLVTFLDEQERQLLADQHAEDFFQEDLTAPQIALYHSLKIKTKWYLDVKPGQLYRFLIQHFGSKERGQMAYDSFRANAYKRNSTDLRVIRGKLLLMVNVIDGMV